MPGPTDEKPIELLYPATFQPGTTGRRMVRTDTAGDTSPVIQGLLLRTVDYNPLRDRAWPDECTASV
jgi:hypothetical protein